MTQTFFSNRLRRPIILAAFLFFNGRRSSQTSCQQKSFPEVDVSVDVEGFAYNGIANSTYNILKDSLSLNPSSKIETPNWLIDYMRQSFPKLLDFLKNIIDDIKDVEASADKKFKAMREFFDTPNFLFAFESILPKQDFINLVRQYIAAEKIETKRISQIAETIGFNNFFHIVFSYSDDLDQTIFDRLGSAFADNLLGLLTDQNLTGVDISRDHLVYLLNHMGELPFEKVEGNARFSKITDAFDLEMSLRYSAIQLLENDGEHPKPSSHNRTKTNGRCRFRLNSGNGIHRPKFFRPIQLPTQSR